MSDLYHITLQLPHALPVKLVWPIQLFRFGVNQGVGGYALTRRGAVRSSRRSGIVGCDMIPSRTHGNERPKLDCSTGVAVSQYGNRMVPNASFSLHATLACTSFNREFRTDNWARHSLALRPCHFLLRGIHGWRIRNVDVGNLEAS